MVNIRQLLTHFINTEQELCQSDFLAPCVRQGCLSTRMNEVAYTLSLKGWPFEGWGLFRPVSFETATLVREADLADVNQYLQRLPGYRLYLVRRLQHRSWLAYPMNASGTRQQLGIAKPMVVHLVTDGGAFDSVIARWDGHAFWFDRLERQTDMTLQLRQSMAKGTRCDDLAVRGLTVEGRTAYSLAMQWSDCPLETQEDWSVHWTTADGDDPITTITKEDLTVTGTGICWSDCDRNFGLGIDNPENWRYSS